VCCSFLLELLALLPGRLVLLVLHILALFILLQLLLQLCIEFGNVDLFVLVTVTVGLGGLQRLLEVSLLGSIGLWLHLLVTLSAL